MKVVEEGRLDLEKVLEIMTRVSDALATAHREKIIHRDIKPANIMILKNQQVKLLDFGLSKPMELLATNLTQSNMLMGTIRYMAPELLQGGRPSTASDIFALGALLFDLLKNVYGLSENSPAEFLERADEEDTKVPLGWISLMDGMCKTRPQNRYQNVSDVLSVLDELSQDRTAKAQPLTSSSKLKRLPRGDVSKIVRSANQLKEERENSVGQETLVDIGRELDLHPEDVRDALEKHQREKEKSQREEKPKKKYLVFIMLAATLFLLFLLFLALFFSSIPNPEPVHQTLPPQTNKEVQRSLTQPLPSPPTVSTHSQTLIDAQSFLDVASIKAPRISTLPASRIVFRENFENHGLTLGEPWYGDTFQIKHSSKLGSKAADGMFNRGRGQVSSLVRVKPSFQLWNVIEADIYAEKRSHNTILAICNEDRSAMYAYWTGNYQTNKITFHVNSEGSKRLLYLPYPTHEPYRIQTIIDPIKMRISGRLIIGDQVHQSEWETIDAQSLFSIQAISLHNDFRYWGQTVGHQVDHVQWVYTKPHSHDYWRESSELTETYQVKKPDFANDISLYISGHSLEEKIPSPHQNFGITSRLGYLQMDGNSHMRIKDHPKLRLDDEEFTLEIAFKTESINGPLLFKGMSVDHAHSEYHVGIGNGYLNFVPYEDNGNYGLESRIRSKTKVNDGLEHHAAIVRSGDRFGMFIDGVFEGEGKAIRVSSIASNRDLLIGTSQHLRQQKLPFYKGQIRFIRLTKGECLIDW